MVHSLDLQKFSTSVDKGMNIANTSLSEGRAAIDEYFYRRWGLGVSTLIISVVAFSLYLTIQRIERRQQSTYKTFNN